MATPAASVSRGVCPSSGCPLNSMRPASGRIIPKRMFIKVVLPEPFSPRSPTMQRSGTTRSMLRLARTEPNDFEMPVMWSIVAPAGLGLGAAARVVLRGLDLELARGELLFQALQLGAHARGDDGIQGEFRRIPQISAAGGRRVVTVRDVVADELA